MQSMLIFPSFALIKNVSSKLQSIENVPAAYSNTYNYGKIALQHKFNEQFDLLVNKLEKGNYRIIMNR